MEKFVHIFFFCMVYLFCWVFFPSYLVFFPVPLQRSHSNHFWLSLLIAWRPFFLASHVLLACSPSDLERPWSSHWRRPLNARLTATLAPHPTTPIASITPVQLHTLPHLPGRSGAKDVLEVHGREGLPASPRVCYLVTEGSAYCQGSTGAVCSVASVMSDFVPLWTVALQAPLFMEFSRQEYWSGLPFPSPGDLADPEIEPRSPALQADSLSLS